jgi:hypothetical protein
MEPGAATPDQIMGMKSFTLMIIMYIIQLLFVYDAFY